MVESDDEAKNGAKETLREEQSAPQDEQKHTGRRKSSTRESKLSPGDHTVVRRADGTWCKYRPTLLLSIFDL